MQVAQYSSYYVDGYGGWSGTQDSYDDTGVSVLGLVVRGVRVVETDIT